MCTIMQHQLSTNFTVCLRCVYWAWSHMDIYCGNGWLYSGPHLLSVFSNAALLWAERSNNRYDLYIRTWALQCQIGKVVTLLPPFCYVENWKRPVVVTGHAVIWQHCIIVLKRYVLNKMGNISIPTPYNTGLDLDINHHSIGLIEKPWIWNRYSLLKI